MATIKKEVFDEVMEEIKKLEQLLNERVVDLHEIKGMMQARHAYVFYRNLISNIKYKLMDNVKH